MTVEEQVDAWLQDEEDRRREQERIIRKELSDERTETARTINPHDG